MDGTCRSNDLVSISTRRLVPKIGRFTYTPYTPSFRGNREYWKQDAKDVAKTGLEKMKKVIRESLE